MGTSSPIDFDPDRLRQRVLPTDERVARATAGGLRLRTGAADAVEALRYSREELAALPDVCTALFAGVGNPHRFGPIRAGATVLDHACGSGVDLLLAARRAGPNGRAIGIELTPAMRTCAEQAAIAAGLGAIVEVREGSFEDLPVANASIDYVISNGVLNLAPDKSRVLEEVARVLKPGGKLHLAAVVVGRAVEPGAHRNVEIQASCVSGALAASDLAALAARAGLEPGGIGERFECFNGTAVAREHTGGLAVYGVTFLATKPAPARPPATSSRF